MKKLFLTFSVLFISIVLFAGKFVFIPVSETNNLETLFAHNDLKIHYYTDDYVLATTDNLNFANLIVLDEQAFGDVDSYAIVYCLENEKESYLQRVANSVKTLYSGENYFIMKKVSEGFVPAKNDGMITVTNTTARLTSSSFVYPVVTEIDTNILNCIKQVDTDNTMSYIQHLQDYGTRRCNKPKSIEAQNWLKEQYESFGLDTTYVQPVVNVYPWWGGGAVQSGNVIAIQYGTEFPNEFVVCGGHYDSFVNGSNNEPGADDNASGTAGVLETARILSQYEFKRSIIYCAFTAEECGIDGSYQFVKYCVTQPTMNILGYFNLDMTGYLKPGNNLKFYLLYPSSALTLADFFVGVCDTYFSEIPVVRKQNHTLNANSDHLYFNQNGYKGVWWFEDVDNTTPYIHTPNDKIGSSVNNPGQVKVFTQALVASVATLAEPIGEIPEYLFPPKNCKAENVETMYVNVTWSAPAEGTPDIFKVYRDNVNIAQTDKRFYMDTVPDYGEYCYTITAIYDEKESGSSNKFCINVTEFIPTYFPPTSCKAEYLEEKSIKVTWDAPENDVDCDCIIKYKVYRDSIEIAAELTALSYIDTVTDYLQHCYLITAKYSETIESEFSNESCTQVPVGINEYGAEIKIFPNPTTGELHIQSSKFKVQNVEIYDVHGKKVGGKFPSNLLEGWQPQADGVVINISHLPAGIYFVKIANEIVGKFIKE